MNAVDPEQTPAPQVGGPPVGGPQVGGLGVKRLVRRSDDRMIAGICSGVAAYLNVDVTLVRVGAVVATILGVGLLIPAYIVAWVLVPEE
ncbi:MAG: PspC domain-containing protein [Nocardioides sp.]